MYIGSPVPLSLLPWRRDTVSLCLEFLHFDAVKVYKVCCGVVWDYCSEATSTTAAATATAALVVDVLHLDDSTCLSNKLCIIKPSLKRTKHEYFLIQMYVGVCMCVWFAYMISSV